MPSSSLEFFPAVGPPPRRLSAVAAPARRLKFPAALRLLGALVGLSAAPARPERSPAFLETTGTVRRCLSLTEQFVVAYRRYKPLLKEDKIKEIARSKQKYFCLTSA
jgi:hypothetical protein